MIVGVGGLLSGGKTAFCVKQSYLAYTKGRRTVSNIKLLYPCDYMSNTDFMDFLLENLENEEALRQKFQGKILLLDEINNLLSSRKSLSNVNFVVSQFMMMLGKLDCDIYYTFQVLESQVDVILRTVTNIYVSCDRINERGEFLFFEKRKVPYKVYFLIRKEINLLHHGIEIIETVEDLEEYFKWYKTEEIVLMDRDKYLKR